MGWECNGGLMKLKVTRRWVWDVFLSSLFYPRIQFQFKSFLEIVLSYHVWHSKCWKVTKINDTNWCSFLLNKQFMNIQFDSIQSDSIQFMYNCINWGNFLTQLSLCYCGCCRLISRRPKITCVQIVVTYGLFKWTNSK